MTVYVVAQLTFEDEPTYRRYQSAFAQVFAKFRGKLLAADERPTVLEGEWHQDKVVLMSFPDEAAHLEWAQSPEYLEIARDRHAGARTTALLVRGIPSSVSRTST